MKIREFDTTKADRVAQLNAATNIIRENSRERELEDRKSYCIISKDYGEFDMGFLTGRQYRRG